MIIIIIKNNPLRLPFPIWFNACRGMICNWWTHMRILSILPVIRTLHAVLIFHRSKIWWNEAKVNTFASILKLVAVSILIFTLEFCPDFVMPWWEMAESDSLDCEWCDLFIFPSNYTMHRIFVCFVWANESPAVIMYLCDVKPKLNAQISVRGQLRFCSEIQN